MNKNINKNLICLIDLAEVGSFYNPMTWVKNYGNGFYKYYFKQLART